MSKNQNFKIKINNNNAIIKLMQKKDKIVKYQKKSLEIQIKINKTFKIKITLDYFLMKIHYNRTYYYNFLLS